MLAPAIHNSRAIFCFVQHLQNREFLLFVHILVHYQPEVFHANIFAEDVRQPVFLYDLFDHEPCADPQAAAPRAPVLNLRDILIREVFEVVLVRWTFIVKGSDPAVP